MKCSVAISTDFNVKIPLFEHSVLFILYISTPSDSKCLFYINLEQQPLSHFPNSRATAAVVQPFYLIGSNRHHLSNDECMENMREDYQNCSMLCYVQESYAMIHTHTREQFLKMSVGLGLGLVFVCLGLPYCVFFCFSLDYFVPLLFALVVLDLVSSVLHQEIG